MHLPDHELLMEADGELSPAAAATAHAHLAECAACRTRQAEILRVLGTTTAAYLDQRLPPANGAVRRLQAKLIASKWPRYAVIGLAAALLLVMVRWTPAREGPGGIRAALTPGAVETVDRNTVCAAGHVPERAVIAGELAREVFRKYGIHDPQPRSFEVDYLIPPELGGSGDVRNLWPQPYKAGRWNSRVKDALEDRLRTMVCQGSLPLEEAQQAIARDWVAAYKRYFGATDPLPDHVAFVKDRPWE